MHIKQRTENFVILLIGTFCSLFFSLQPKYQYQHQRNDCRVSLIDKLLRFSITVEFYENHP